MKRPLLLLTILLATSIQAQLVNTTWAIYNMSDEYFLDAHFAPDDTLYAYPGGNNVVPLAVYSVSGDTLTVTHAHPEDDCTGIGTYTFTISNDTLELTLVEDPCPDRAFIFVNFTWVAPMSTNVVDRSAGSDLQVHPIPATDELFLERSTTEQLQVLLFDMKGDLVLETLFTDARVRLDLKDLPPAVYVLQARSKNGIASRRIILE